MCQPPETRVNEGEELTSTSEWRQYAADPSPATLGALLSLTTLRDQHAGAMHELLGQTGNGRVAQHLALLHMGAFKGFEQTDLVRGYYYAMRGRDLLVDDPPAHARCILVMADVFWCRRIPAAVFPLTDVVKRELLALRPTTAAELRRRDVPLTHAYTLDGMCLAYLRNTPKALVELQAAERLCGLAPESLAQLLVAAEPDDPEASAWCAERLGPAPELGARVGALLLRSHRRRLLWTLLRRGVHPHG